MKTKIDPFTRTPGVAGKAYIDNGVADTIISNFCSPESEKYVYKITGLRGSGKSVEYSKVIRTLKEKKDWLVYPLSATGEAVSTLISRLSMEKFIARSYADNDHFYSEEAVLTHMIGIANGKGYNVLVGVDDIARTPEMINLLSMIGSMILEGLQIYLVVTGLSDNIEDFSSEKNLTFFKRADAIEIGALNKYDITYMYEKLLEIDAGKAKEIEALTNGYAYAYQVLGSLYFGKKKDESLDDIIPEFERILFRDSYDLIWKSLTAGEKDVVRCIYKTGDGKAEAIKSLMSNPSTYSVYRDRLIRKHLVDGNTRGYLKIKLPRFDRFIELWGDE